MTNRKFRFHVRKSLGLIKRDKLGRFMTNDTFPPSPGDLDDEDEIIPDGINI